MGVYKIYTKNGNGTISFQTGDDEYFTTGESQLNQNINALGGLSPATVETNFNSIDSSGLVIFQCLFQRNIGGE